MPTYEYRCPAGHQFELFQRMSDEPVANCPECGAAAERKISGGAGFLFKGEGFYITDYRSEDYKKKASAEAGAGDTPGTGSGGSTSTSASGESSSTSPPPAAEGAPAPKPKPGPSSSD